jgi:hypothetical protein
MTSGGASVELRIVEAGFAEREQFEAPDTGWRIAGGELALIPPRGVLGFS